MKPNCSKNQRAGGRGHWLGGLSLGALALALAAAVAHSEIVFDNMGEVGWFDQIAAKMNKGIEIGDELLLQAAAPVALANFAFKYYGLNFNGTEQVRLRFYRKNPISLMPDLLLYDSGWGGASRPPNPGPGPLRDRCIFSPGALLPGTSGSNTLSGAATLQFSDFVTGAVVPLTERVPINFVWTVEYRGLTAPAEAGLLLTHSFSSRFTAVVMYPRSYVWDWEQATVGKDLKAYWQRINVYWMLLQADHYDFDEVFPVNFQSRVEGDAPLQFLPPSREKQGLLLTLVGKTGSQYRIQSSTNLVYWSEMQTNTATNGVISATVPAAGDGKFYRALMVE